MSKNYSVKLPDGMAAAFDAFLMDNELKAYTFFQRAVEKELTVTNTKRPPPKVPPKRKMPWWDAAHSAHSMIAGGAVDPESMPLVPRLRELCEEIRLFWQDVSPELRPKLAQWMRALDEKTPLPRTMRLDAFELGSLEAARDEWIAQTPKLTLPTANSFTDDEDD